RAERQRRVGHSTDAHGPARELQVVWRNLEEPGRDPERLIPDLPRGDPDRVAARDEAAAGEGPGAPVELAGVAGDDRDVGGVAPERVGGDLGERRLVTLALGGEAGGHVDLSARLDADVGSLVRPDARALHVAADPKAEVPPLASSFRLAAAEVAGADPLERQLEAEWVVAAVVAGGAAILERQPDVPRELVRLDEVTPSHLGRLQRELARDQTDDPLHDEGPVGPPGPPVRRHHRRVRVYDLEFHRVVPEPIRAGELGRG